MPYADPDVGRAYHRAYYLSHEGAAKARQQPKLTAEELRSRKAERDRAYHLANVAEIKVQRAGYRATNRRRLREADRRRRLADPEGERQRATAASRRFRARHPERTQEHRRAWLTETPDRAAAVRTSMTANRRARMYGADGQIGYETVLELWRRQPHCIDCGEGFGLDHVIPLSRGGSNTSGNLANRCRSCNSRKGTRIPEELAS